jgi:hypothetical protein
MHYVRIDRFVPNLLSSNEIDLLSDRWLMYSIEAIDVSWIIKQKYNDSERNEYIKYQEYTHYITW